MFGPRQLLALSTLLKGIMVEENQTLREMLLCAFSNTLEGNNLFVRNRVSRQSPGGTAPGGIFARHDYQPKATSCEQNVWGTVSGTNTFVSRVQMLRDGIRFRSDWKDDETKQGLDPIESTSGVELTSGHSEVTIPSISQPIAHVITDPHM